MSNIYSVGTGEENLHVNIRALKVKGVITWKSNHIILHGGIGIWIFSATTLTVFKSLDCLKVTSHLFDSMSGQSGIDHPLC